MSDKYESLLDLVKQFINESEKHTGHYEIATGGGLKLPSISIEFVCVPRLEQEHFKFIEWYNKTHGQTDWGQNTYNAYVDLQAWVAHENNAQ